MKAYLTSSIELDPKGLNEIKSLIPGINLDVQYTSETIKPSWNRYFMQVWGDFDWLRSLMPKDGVVRAYATSSEDLVAKGITGHIGMFDLTDSDKIADFYFGIPTKLDKRAKTNGFTTNLAWLFIHEYLHSREQQAGFKDAVHEMEAQGRLKEMLAKHLERDELVKKVGMLERILELLGIVNSLKKKVYLNPTDLLPIVKRKADAVVLEMERLGHPVRIVEGYRSPERQTELYNQGRTTPGAIVTNAKAGESLHNYGCAIDLVFRKEGYNASEALWQLLGKVGKLQGFEWGGDFKSFQDRPHLEMKLGYNLRDFQNGKVDYNKFN